MTIPVAGVPVTLPKTVVLNTGWTFLPCPYQTSAALALAAPSFPYTVGDQLKSQLQFAEFYSGFGWYGSLAALAPGVGYLIKTAMAGNATFQP